LHPTVTLMVSRSCQSQAVIGTLGTVICLAGGLTSAIEDSSAEDDIEDGDTAAVDAVVEAVVGASVHASVDTAVEGDVFAESSSLWRSV